MNTVTLGEIESRFAEIIWQNEPIASRELVPLCEKEFGWKKSTTYTVLKRLVDKGIFLNRDGTVTSLISREELNVAQTEQIIEEKFHGSLPSFLVAFTRKNRLSESDIEEIRRIIEESRDGSC